MAWSTPITAVSNAILTAAQWNATVRDNLAITAPALATAAGTIFVGTGVNSVAQRIPAAATVNTSQTTASTSFTDLTTVGPTVSTITTGTKALMMFGAQMGNTLSNALLQSAVAISGATTSAPDTSVDLYIDGLPANQFMRASVANFYTTLTAGSNTFKQQYKVGSGTGTFLDRHLAIIPL